jgi:hypothetical protein
LMLLLLPLLFPAIVQTSNANAYSLQLSGCLLKLDGW